MKKLIFSLVALCLMGAACEKMEPADVYSKEISFTEYSLPEGCGWDGLVSDSLYLINSQEELMQNLACWANVVVEFDFSKYTLLLASGTMPNGIENIEKNLQQLSINAYKLDLNITLNDATVVEKWCVALVTHKLSAESQVQLNVSTNDFEVEYPIEIPFEDYSLEGTSCQWKNLSKDSCNYSQVAVINSNEELENYIDCTNGTYPEIDFSKHTLLLANGVRCYQDHLNYVDIKQLSRQKYVLKVDFQISVAAALREWQVAVIVSKLENGSDVTLDGGNVEFLNQ